MKSPARFLLTLSLALALTNLARGAITPDQALREANCTLTPPPGWQPLDLKQQHGIVAAYGDAAGDRTLLVLVFERGKAAEPISDEFVAGFDKGVEKSGGGQKLSGKFVLLTGLQAYERRGTAVVKGRNVTTLALALPTGDGTYLLEAVAAHGIAAEDVAIRQSIDTFRFLRPPGAPQVERGAPYRAGYLVGQGLVGLLIAGLFVWAISKAVGRGKAPLPPVHSGTVPYPYAGQPPGPPPLPPPGPPAPPPLPPVS